VNKRPKSKYKNEQSTDVILWPKDGCLCSHDARVDATTELFVGRTNSKRAIGFVITRGKQQIDFVLDRDQVENLAAFLNASLAGLSKPAGRRRPYLNFADLARAELRK
jgi:hypothetical protein